MKKFFLTGLVTLLPVAVTIWLISFFVELLTKPFIGIVSHFLKKMPEMKFFSSDAMILVLSKVLILCLLFSITIFLGLIARRYFFDSVLKLTDKALHRIPFVNKIYGTTKEIIHSLFSADAKSFSQVVLMKFPNQDSYCLGLIAGDAPDTCSEKSKQNLISVFIPTTPNPMTGYIVMMEKEHLIYLQMTTEEAIKYVVSLAVIQPSAPLKT